MNTSPERHRATPSAPVGPTVYTTGYACRARGFPSPAPRDFGPDSHPTTRHPRLLGHSPGPTLPHHMPPPNNDPSRPPDTGSTFRDRLMYYMFGVALGCVMIGMMFSIRSRWPVKSRPGARPGCRGTKPSPESRRASPSNPAPAHSLNPPPPAPAARASRSPAQTRRQVVVPPRSRPSRGGPAAPAASTPALRRRAPRREPSRCIRVRGKGTQPQESQRRHPARPVGRHHRLSGSGKVRSPSTPSSPKIAQYMESLSPTRQFLDQLKKPDVEEIDGIPPTIAIEQRGSSANPRSTVAPPPRSMTT